MHLGMPTLVSPVRRCARACRDTAVVSKPCRRAAAPAWRAGGKAGGRAGGGVRRKGIGVCVRVRVRVRVRARVCGCVRACVSVCVCVRAWGQLHR